MAAPSPAFRLASPGPRFQLQMLLAWLGVLLAAMGYCWLHAWFGGDLSGEGFVALRWALVHWGAWPLLLPLCHRLIRRYQRRGRLGLGLLLGAALAILGATAFARFLSAALGSDWPWGEALFHMLPIAGGSYLLFVLIAFWLLRPSLLATDTSELEHHEAAPEQPAAGHSEGDAKADPPQPEHAEARQRLEVSTGSRETQVEAAQIGWIQGARNYVELHDEQRSYILRSPLHELEALLMPAGFIRIHRSYLVNRRWVVAAARGEASLRLRNGTVLPVGRSYREALAELGLGAHD